MNTLKSLLDDIAKTTAPSYAENHSFNIFKVLGIQTKEVIICRLIGELLDPNGSHNMGTQPLARFFELVLQEAVPANLKNAQIKLEEPIDENRRVDIAIHVGRLVYPIEVKVWAGDQDAQLFDYYQYYKTHHEIDTICYLTPYGWKPSKESAKGLDSEKVRCRSFQNEVCAWLDALNLECAPNNVITTILQFREVIADMVAKNYTVEQIKSLLNLDSVNPFEVNGTVQAAVSLLNAKDALAERIIVNYLQSALRLPAGYSLEEDTAKTVDKHSLFRIMKDDVAVAWVCVEKNLYIVAQKVKSPHLWKEARDDYFWEYLHPNGTGKKFPLKLLSCIFEHTERIEIEDLLNDIVE